MTAVLDLTKRHWTRVKGPITLIGTWLKNADDRWRPAMVLIRTGDEKCEHCVPCVVTVDRCWIWSEEIGNPREAARTAFEFIRCLRGNEHDPREVIRMGMLINDHLDDLMHIPPYLPEAGDVFAELTITDRSTGKVREVEMRDDV